MNSGVVGNWSGGGRILGNERGRDQGGITGRICASCLMGAKKFPREG